MTTTTAVTPYQRLCGNKVAPKIAIGLSPEKAGQAVRTFTKPCLNQTTNHQRGTNGNNDQGDRLAPFTGSIAVSLPRHRQWLE